MFLAQYTQIVFEWHQSANQFLSNHQLKAGHFGNRTSKNKNAVSSILDHTRETKQWSYWHLQVGRLSFQHLHRMVSLHWSNIALSLIIFGLLLGLSNIALSLIIFDLLLGLSKIVDCGFGASLMAQLVKNLPAMQETWVRFLGWEDPLEEG